LSSNRIGRPVRATILPGASEVAQAPLRSQTRGFGGFDAIEVLVACGRSIEVLPCSSLWITAPFLIHHAIAEILPAESAD
jgi:hypothetical protein